MAIAYGTKGYNEMKEQEMDELERLFRNGLKDLEADPDDSVWNHIASSVQKPRKKFWYFWMLIPLIVLSTLGGILYQAYSNEETTLVSKEVEVEDESRYSPDNYREGEPIDGSTNAPQFTDKGHTQENKIEEETGISSDGQMNPEQQVASENQDKVENYPSASLGTPHQDNSKKQTPTNKNGSKTNEIPENNIPVVNPNTETGPENVNQSDDNKPEIIIPEKQDDVQTTTIKIPGPLSLNPIPFLLSEKAEPALALLPERKGQDEEDKQDMKKTNYLSAYVEAGTSIPSVKTTGMRGDVNFDKTTESVFGGILQIGLQYTLKSNWTIRSGIAYTSYTLNGKYSYYGLLDTLEWIDRDRNTGVYVGYNQKEGKYSIKYDWIQVPLEIGRIQHLNDKFEWNWTLGASMNYLASKGTFQSKTWYMEETNNSLQRLQWQWMFGFGASYTVNPKAKIYLQTRYQYQPGAIYSSTVLSEKHNFLSFRAGISFYLGKKGAFK